VEVSEPDDTQIVATLRKEAGHADVEWEPGAGDFFRRAADRIEALVARVQELEAERDDQDVIAHTEVTQLQAKVQELERENAITEGAHELTARTLAKARDQIKELEREVARLKQEAHDDQTRENFHRGLYDK
jgi:DNA repair exonuclease SbcCD ATPase subunit